MSTRAIFWSPLASPPVPPYRLVGSQTVKNRGSAATPGSATTFKTLNVPVEYVATYSTTHRGSAPTWDQCLCQDTIPGPATRW